MPDYAPSTDWQNLLPGHPGGPVSPASSTAAGLYDVIANGVPGLSAQGLTWIQGKLATGGNIFDSMDAQLNGVSLEQLKAINQLPQFSSSAPPGVPGPAVRLPASMGGGPPPSPANMGGGLPPVYEDPNAFANRVNALPPVDPGTGQPVFQLPPGNYGGPPKAPMAGGIPPPVNVIPLPQPGGIHQTPGVNSADIVPHYGGYADTSGVYAGPPHPGAQLHQDDGTGGYNSPVHYINPSPHRRRIY